MWMQLRIADEKLTFLAEAALENSQVDKAHRTDPEGAGERHRGKRRRMTVGASRAGASDMPGSPCRELKDDNKTPGQPSDLEYVLRQREGNANRRGLECVAHVR